MYKMLGVIALALAAFAVTDARQPSAPVKASRLASLAVLYSGPGGAVRDTNGDDLPDAVVARVIVPARPTADDVEAAANIAARLGYETTAMTLPVVLRDEEVRDAAGIGLPILVGRENSFVKRLVERRAIDLAALQPGQGIVQAVASPLGGADGLVVVGGDDPGTLAAAVQLAARVPRLWTMTGATLPGVERQAADFLQRKGVPATGARVVSLLVDAERRGIGSIGLEVSVAEGEGARAAAAFTELDAAHRQGREDRVLNFSEAAAADIRLVAASGEVGRAVVRRAGLNGRTLTPPVDPDEFLPDPTPDRPAGAPDPRLAPAKPFDLSSSYSLEGWFGDAYADLIPDRTETTVVLGGAAGLAGRRARRRAAGTGDHRHHACPSPAGTTRSRSPPTSRPDPHRSRQHPRAAAHQDRQGATRRPEARRGRGAGRASRLRQRDGHRGGRRRRGRDLAASFYLARRAPYVWDVERGAPTLEDVVDRGLALPAGEERRWPGRPGAARDSEDVVDEPEGQEDRVVGGEAVPREGATRRWTKYLGRPGHRGPRQGGRR